MTENRLPIDDPRLTAYALGELPADEAAQFEALLADSPASWAAVDEIRELAGLLSDQLRREPAPALSAAQRSAILSECGRSPLLTRPAAAVQPSSPAPRLLAGVGTTAAVIDVASRQRVRFASLVTVAAMLMIAFLITPRDRGERRVTDNSRRGVLAREGDVALRYRNADSRDAVDFAFKQRELSSQVRLDRYGEQLFEESADDSKFDDHVRDRLAAEGLEIDGSATDSVTWKDGEAAENKPGQRDPRLEVQRRLSELKSQAPADESQRSDSLSQSGVGGGGALHGAGAVLSKSKERREPVDELQELSDRAKGDRQGGQSVKPADEKVQGEKGGRRSGRAQTLSAGANEGAMPSKKLNGKVAADDRSGPGAGQLGGGLAPFSGMKGPAAKGAVRAGSAQAEDGIQLPAQEADEPQMRSMKKESGGAAPFAESRLNGQKAGQAGGGEMDGVGRIRPFNTSRGAKPGSSDNAPEGAVKELPVLTESGPAADAEGEELSKFAKSKAGGRYYRTPRILVQEEMQDLADSPDATVAKLNERGRQLNIAGDKAEAGVVPAQDFTRREIRDLYRVQADSPDAEVYDPIVENLFVAPTAEPLSTFSVDVDSASYANVRRFITQGRLPPPNAVRVEELVNYFSYDYPQPAESLPFSVNIEVGRAPWRPEHRLVRIGLKGREIPRDRRPPSNLVFLVDVSGSMASDNKLPLVKQGLTLLTQQLGEGDRAAIVTYSDTAALRLDSTAGDQKKQIFDTINGLQAAGSTNGAGGIQLAYDTAAGHFIDGGTNRVILCTDGDFNVGVTSDDELVKLIQDRARSKVFFSVFGFGMGNLKDGKLEKLADKGNGHYAYVDGQRETHKVFVDELSANLVTIAKDVKLQVEFNPARVGGYRLIGYENRALATQDFHNDKKDAGEIGAGHSVTALYEILPADRLPQPPADEGLRYQRIGLPQAGELAGELLTVKLRYKQPEADTSSLMVLPVADPLPNAFDAEDRKRQLEAPAVASRPSRDFEWAAAVAAYGMVLRDSQFRGQAGLDLVAELAQGAKGEDANGRRQEFIDLVQQTKGLRPDLAMPGQMVLGREPAATPDVQNPTPPAAPLGRDEARLRASVGQKYSNLLRVIPADGDEASYGPFHDFGRWEGTSYLGHDNLPQGHWVYVAPNWYIWGDAGQKPKADNGKP